MIETSEVRLESPKARADIGGDPVRHGTIELLTQMLRENRLKPDELRTLGENLWCYLFADNEVGRKLDELIKPGWSIGFELVIKGTDGIASWPWEYMYRPSEANVMSGYYLSKAGSVCRELPIKNARQLLVDSGEIVVLFVAASPTPANGEVLTKVEYAALAERLRTLAVTHKIKFAQLPPPSEGDSDDGFRNDKPAPVTYETFKNMVKNWRPNVIHFLGHGKLDAGKGWLGFEGTDQRVRWIDDQTIAQDLMKHDFPRLIFLQACESAMSSPRQAVSGVAAQLAQKNVPAIVAMQSTISNGAASQFAEAFYVSLLSNGRVTDAVAAGRDTIADITGDELDRQAFGLPVVYLRGRGALIPEPASQGPTNTNQSRSVPSPDLSQSTPTTGSGTP